MFMFIATNYANKSEIHVDFPFIIHTRKLRTYYIKLFILYNLISTLFICVHFSKLRNISVSSFENNIFGKKIKIICK